MLMENVQSFLNAAKKYGVADEEVFQTPDLFEARNLPQVALCIFSLGNTTLYTRAANDPSVFIIMEKAPTRAFSWLKVPTSACTFNTLIRYNAKKELTYRTHRTPMQRS